LASLSGTKITLLNIIYPCYRIKTPVQRLIRDFSVKGSNILNKLASLSGIKIKIVSIIYPCDRIRNVHHPCAKID